MRAAASSSSWEPRYALHAYEQHTNFPAHRDHIVNQRARLETLALPSARRIALAIGEWHLPVNRLVGQLEQELYAGLERTVRFGYREAQREIRAQRHGAPTVLARYYIADVGRYARSAQHGLPGIYELVRHRSRQVARNVSDAAQRASVTAHGQDKVAQRLAVTIAATKALHNSVLELVGESLNLGRTAGALEMPQPPEFALRSAQLDERSCEACDELHGDIVQVGSAEYFDEMPPAECFGGGRCRCIYVFGD